MHTANPGTGDKTKDKEIARYRKVNIPKVGGLEPSRSSACYVQDVLKMLVESIQ